MKLLRETAPLPGLPAEREAGREVEQEVRRRRMEREEEGEATAASSAARLLWLLLEAAEVEETMQVPQLEVVRPEDLPVVAVELKVQAEPAMEAQQLPADICKVPEVEPCREAEEAEGITVVEMQVIGLEEAGAPVTSPEPVLQLPAVEPLRVTPQTQAAAFTETGHRPGAPEKTARLPVLGSRGETA